ncbi:MAG: NlpC/P60 family protein, partial [Candidatus Geothermincolales bacterium]
GRFRPADPASRAECARALVCAFGYGSKSPDPSVAFTDLDKSHPAYRWANLAVSQGLMDARPDGSFAPGEPVLFEEVARGACRGLQLEEQARSVQGIFGPGYPHAGVLVLFMDLRLKYSGSRVWPGKPYPRGELAYTLWKLDGLDGWRVRYVKDTFTAKRCQVPAMGDEQRRALNYAAERIGCPYVYGGERESEGGFDCSGLVYNVFSLRMGYPMKRVADDQARDERYLKVTRDSLKPGDSVFFFGDEGGRITSYVNHAGIYLGNGLFIHSTGSNSGVSVDCLDTSGYWGSHFAWGRRIIGGPYLDRFDTWLLLFNPNPEPVDVAVDYLRPSDPPVSRSYQVPARSRYTVPVDSLLSWDEVSMVVRASEGVVAERAMYFNYQGWADGGHVSNGCTPSLAGHFAEGYTGEGFHTWLLLANPEERSAEVEVTYLREGKPPLSQRYVLAPRSRFTVFVNQVQGLGPESVGISYRSLNGVEVLAERAVYFRYKGKIRGGHCSQAVTEPSRELFFAEGYTGEGFDTWILLANPNPEDARVRLSYLLPGGGEVRDERTVPAFSRLTLNTAEKVPGSSFGVHLVSENGVGIVAERAMYFVYRGKKDGGHCSAAVPAAGGRWYMAEGYTGGDFETWILLANPNPEVAEVEVGFYREDGREIKRKLMLPPLCRETLEVKTLEGLESCSFAVTVSSSRPVFAERSVYFVYRGWTGGSNAQALPAASDTFYFAEGYTGG